MKDGKRVGAASVCQENGRLEIWPSALWMTETGDDNSLINSRTVNATNTARTILGIVTLKLFFQDRPRSVVKIDAEFSKFGITSSISNHRYNIIVFYQNSTKL